MNETNNTNVHSFMYLLCEDKCGEIDRNIYQSLQQWTSAAKRRSALAQSELTRLQDQPE